MENFCKHFNRILEYFSYSIIRQNLRSVFNELFMYGTIIPSILRLYHHITVRCHG
nr:MAG TPA: hypothetical protein [Caudoviricetes sp.]